MLYVLEAARKLAEHKEVKQVIVFTRLIQDTRVGKVGRQKLSEPLNLTARGAHAQEYGREIEEVKDLPSLTVVRQRAGPLEYLRKELLWPYIEGKRSGHSDCLIAHHAVARRVRRQLPHLVDKKSRDAKRRVFALCGRRRHWVSFLT